MRPHLSSLDREDHVTAFPSERVDHADQDDPREPGEVGPSCIECLDLLPIGMEPSFCDDCGGAEREALERYGACA